MFIGSESTDVYNISLPYAVLFVSVPTALAAATFALCQRTFYFPVFQQDTDTPNPHGMDTHV
jgi:hypothetical protein